LTSPFVKHWRLVSLLLGIIVLFWILYLLRAVLLPFAVGLVLAYLFVPLISWVERKLPPRNKWAGFKRVSATLAIFLLLLGLIGGFSYFLATAVIDASQTLLHNAPYYFSEGFQNVQEWFEVLRQQFPPEIRTEIDQTLREWGLALGRGLRDTLLQGITFAPATVGAVIGFAALPFFLFYILKDTEKLKKSFYSAFTPPVAEHVKNIVLIIERVLGRYIRAQLMLGLIVGYFAFLGLFLLQIPFAPVLAMLAGITELIPTLGPWIGGGVAAIVTLALVPEKVLWVIVLFLSVQMVENYFLVPRVQSAYLHIHPAVMIFLLVLGAYIAGFWGLLLAAPLTATIVEIIKYERQVFQEKETDKQTS